MPSHVIIPDLSPLLVAMEENLHGHVAYVQRRLAGMTVEDREDLLLTDSGLHSDTFNKIARARLTQADADRRIAEALGYFRNARRPFAWWVGPCSRPLDLERRLEEHGLRAAEFERGMAMELAQLPERPAAPADLSVRRVRDSGELADFAAVLADCVEPPDPAVIAFYRTAAPVLLREDCPMRLFVGYLNGKAAATSELFAGGGVAGIHSVATRSVFRRRGLGLALTWAALQEARRLGLSTATLQASEGGQGVYARLSFRAYCHFAEYRSSELWN
ncbi:MAG: GNAT family N-acetyltransferase [Acidobacteria bacterium]|nr:GNAT family N-acetyltransferase [Acidobacteriota bacterium]